MGLILRKTVWRAGADWGICAYVRSTEGPDDVAGLEEVADIGAYPWW